MCGIHVRRAIKAYKRNVLPIVLTIFAFYAVLLVILVPTVFMPLSELPKNGSDLKSLVPIFSLGFALIMVFGNIFYGGVVSVFVNSLRGRSSIGDMVEGMKKFWEIAAANIINFFILVSIFALSLLWAGFSALFVKFNPLLAFTVLFFFLFLSAPFLLVTHAVVIDGCGPKEAIKKSFQTVKKDYFTFLGLTFLFFGFLISFTVIPIFGDALVALIGIPIYGLAATDFYLKKR